MGNGEMIRLEEVTILLKFLVYSYLLVKILYLYSTKTTTALILATPPLAFARSINLSHIVWAVSKKTIDLSPHFCYNVTRKL
jgi:hypothetical protein